MKKSLLFSLFLICACAPMNPKRFTHTTYTNWNWTDAHLKRVQFYISHDIVLYRFLGENEVLKLKNGKVEMYKGRRVEKVYIYRYTKGGFVGKKNGEEEHFGISFEDSDELFLTFGPHPRRGGEYNLLAKEWNNGVPTITYGGVEFEVILPIDPYTGLTVIPWLIIDWKGVEENATNFRVAKGREVKN